MKPQSTIVILTKSGAQLSARCPLTKKTMRNIIEMAFKEKSVIMVESSDENEAVMWVHTDDITMISVANITEKPTLSMTQGGLVGMDGSKLQ